MRDTFVTKIFFFV